jgi:hypothetical protein
MMLVAAKRKLKADRAATPSEHEKGLDGAKHLYWRSWRKRRAAAKTARKAARTARRVSR